MKFNISENQYQIIKNILGKYPYQFYVFGSRVKGTHRNLSDFDLCFMGNIPDATITKIKGDFEDSDLPFQVDIIDFNRCSDDFKKLIQKDLVLFS
jgi:predicted nucleotidyltransferase